MISTPLLAPKLWAGQRINALDNQPHFQFYTANIQAIFREYLLKQLIF
jgi:hypothetical protein